MKKLLFTLLFLPSIAVAAQVGDMTVLGTIISERMDVSTHGKVVSIGFIDGSSQTTAGFLRVDDEGTFVMGTSTINCVGTAITCSDVGGGVTRIQVIASGGGSSGGGVAIYDGATETGASTFTVAGAKFDFGSGITTITVLFNGVISASHTNVNFWSSTRALASFLSLSISTTISKADFNLLNSTAGSTDAALNAKFSSYTIVLAGNQQITALAQGANITLSQSGSTLTIAGAAGSADGKGSPLAVTTGTFVMFDGIPVSSPTTFLVFSSAAFQSKLAGASTNYMDINYASVTAQGDVLAAVGSSTRAGASFFSTNLSTTVNIDAWNTAKSTTVQISAWELAKSTTVNQTAYNTAKSSSDTGIEILKLQQSTDTIVFNGGVTITAFIQGSGISLSQSGSSLTVAATGGGTGGGGGFTFDGTVNTAYTTFSAVGPFGISPVATSNGISTFTVLGATNPYRTISLPASAWVGCGISSASKINGGFVMTSTSTAYNTFGDTFHLFDAPNTTTSFVCTSFRMPFEWNGDSVAFQVVWHSTGYSGQTVDKLMGWSFGGVAISSGSSIYTAITSSVTTFSAFSSTNTDLYTLQSAAYSILGTPLPGSRVKLALNAGGGGFTGLPRMTECLLYYRQGIWDGRLR